MTSFILEIRKMMRKARTYIGPIALSLLTLAVALGVKHDNHAQYMRRRMENDFIVAGSMLNAAFLCRVLLEFIAFTFLPLFVCMVCADLMASESADGTMRMVLVRPITRARVLISKYTLGMLYALKLTVGTGLFAYLLGWLMLGRGSLVIFENGIWVVPEHTAILRLLAAYALIGCGMMAVGSIAFAVSTFLSNANGAIGAAMGVLYGSAVIGQIQYFAKLKPYLLTSPLEKWGEGLTGPFDANTYLHSIGLLLTYAVVSFVIGLVIFERRDILG